MIVVFYRRIMFGMKFGVDLVKKFCVLVEFWWRYEGLRLRRFRERS